MEIKIGSKEMLTFLHIMAWVIFIGICIEAGGLIFNTFFALVINPISAKNFWMQIDLSNLINYDKGYFLVVTAIMSIVALMKALMFYLIVKLFYNKVFDFNRPFNSTLNQLISNLAYLSFGIGLFSIWGLKYSAWLRLKGIIIPSVDDLHMGGADVWLFMSVILFVIAQIFKRGIEIQIENDLTV
ncbi:DUF2975 domain-containing protein [Sediminibacterium sp.]|uniref:DUF2975 domain-containing protein n=1 Tax=Sediminibacterium sp. TaxID=1917865 RepID=UPI0025D9ECD4|nr:DUF2975 domain-containing protein [Sediminibacterium sp.]MBT9483640.1 DUF2975 domain-containing protein [Sediminibacterium sp.]